MAIDATAPALAVGRQFGVYEQRARRARLVRFLAAAALAAGVAWLGLAGLYDLGLLPPALLPAALAAPLLLLLAAGVLGLAHRPTPAGLAGALDSRLDNRQRLVTAVELLAGPPASALAEAQLASTAALLAGADPRAVYPMPRRAAWFGLATGLVLVALGLILLKGVPLRFTPLQPGQLPADAAAASAPTPTAASDLPPGASTPPPAAATDMPPRGAAYPPPDPADVARQAAASQTAQAGLQRLAQALDGQGATQAAADALRQGHYDQAAQELTNLGEQSDQLSPAAKQSLANALEQAANDPATPPDLRRAERLAADALRGGDYASVAQALKDLGDAVRRAGSDVLSHQDLAKDFPTPAGPGAAGTPGPAGPAQAQGTPDPNGSNGTTGDPGPAGQNGQANAQPGQGPQNGSQPGAAQAGDASQSADPENGGGGAGQGTRVNGPSGGAVPDVAGNPFELENQPAPGQPGSNPGTKPPGVTVDSGGGSSPPGAPANGAPETQPGESNRLPLDRWQIIQRYFSHEQ